MKFFKNDRVIRGFLLWSSLFLAVMVRGHEEGGEHQKGAELGLAVTAMPEKGFKVLQKITVHPLAFGASKVTKEALVDIMRTYSIVPASFVDIDLRGEPHIFVNGEPQYIEALRLDSAQALLAYEKDLVGNLNKGATVSVRKRFSKTREGGKKKINYAPLVVPVGARVETEGDIANELGITYIRIPNEDFVCPTIDSIYLFIQKVAPLLHDGKHVFLIHCHGGKGRTGFYATVFDILINAQKDSLDAIIKRQFNIFSLSLFRPKKKSCERALTLSHISTYIRGNKDAFKTPPAAFELQSCMV